MNCQHTQALFNDYLDRLLPVVESGAVESHCENCVSCAGKLTEFKTQMSLLKSLPEFQVPHGFQNRVLHKATQKTVSNDIRYTFAAAAMLAALVLWFGLLTITDVNENSLNRVAVGSEIRTIRVAIDSENSFDEVKLRIELSDNLELVGFGNKKDIYWTTKLRQGVNVISLPIIGIAAGGGDITTRIQLGDKEKVMRIYTDYKLPESVFYKSINFGGASV